MFSPDDIIPSNLRITRTGDSKDAFGNVMLRFGEVIDIIPPDDKRSLSKKVMEYTVLVQHRANRTAVTKAYHHCFLINSLAGAADESTFTLRVDPNRKKGKTGLGSKVLILCINGETNNAVIVGGIRDQASTYDKDTQKKGHHLHWVFNGVQFDVNDDGELHATFKGKTKVDGKPDDSVSKDAAGGTFEATKDGKFKAKPKKGFEIGEATDHMLLGESFRKEQQQLNQKLKGYCDTLQTLLQTAGSAITAAAQVPAVNGVAPAGFAPAGAALISAAAVAKNMSAALDAFEQAASQKNSFLSKQNSND